MEQRIKPVNLALQGGGSHGALTWGVLDRLLDEPRVQIAEVSGTSAGAMNAVVLADGYAQGGRTGAQQKLRAFWKAVSDAARFSPAQRTWWDRMLGRYSLDHSPGYLMMEGLGRLYSPYELNPLDLNPLRDLLVQQVDFSAVNRPDGIRVHVTGTNVRSGLPRVFSTGAIGPDAVLLAATTTTTGDGSTVLPDGIAFSAALEAALARNPQLSRTSVLFSYLDPADLSQIGFYTSHDTRPGFLESLGHHVEEAAPKSC